MSEKEKTIGPIIKSKYDSFTQLEKGIADFFLNNQKKMELSAKKISELLYVSEASLSRFAQKCGFRGYREFVYQYEKSFHETSCIHGTTTKSVLEMYQELLNDCYGLADEVQIARVIRYLNETDGVVVCGKGSSGLVASEMETRFMRIGVNIDSIRDSDRMVMQAVFMNKKNLVCGMSISGKTEEVLYLLRESHKRGATTVLFTANHKEDFKEFCTEIVLIPSLKFLDQGNVISPQFPLLLMVDIIYYYYLNQDKDSKELLHDHTLEALGNAKRRINIHREV